MSSYDWFIILHKSELLFPGLLLQLLLFTFHNELVFALYLLLFLADDFAEGLLINLINILVDAIFQSFHQFVFDFLFDIGCNKGFLLSDSISPFGFLLDWNNFFFSFKLHLPHPYEHLPEFRQSLLALMNLELRPIHQIFVNLFQCPLVVLVKLHLFPQFVRHMCPFCCLHIEIADAFLLSDRGILRVSEGTASSVAQSRKIVLIVAEVLAFRF